MMGYLKFYDKLNSMEDKEYIEKFLVYNLSLVIAGVKPAVTLTIKKNNYKLYDNWNTLGHIFINKLNLNYIELRESINAIVVMVYDKLLLEKILISEQNLEFLKNLEYPTNFEINDYVNTLKVRYEKYHCPHELGLFLGIPFKDVKDFMDCTTKECLMCKYWKVYNDSTKAKKTFDTYDKIKDYTMENILKGNSSMNLILSIKNSFNESKVYSF